MSKDLPSWFYNVQADKNFLKHLSHLKNEKCDLLQIGAYTGDASLWLCENILINQNSYLEDVDTWLGSDENTHKEMDWQYIENIYNEKIKKYIDSKKVVKNKMSSDDFFKINNKRYDFIYIDGDHRALSVLNDSVNAFFSLKVGGIIGFDDYLWDEPRSFFSPKSAIDSFLLIFKDHIDVLDIGYQVYVKKINDIDLDYLK